MVRWLKNTFKYTVWLMATLFAIGLFVGKDDNEPTTAHKAEPIALVSDVSSNSPTITKPDIKTTPTKPISHVPKAAVAPAKPNKKSTAKSVIKLIKPKKPNLPNPKVVTAALGYKYISKNSVNVRALPTVKSQKLGNLKRNTQMNYYQFKAGWYQIKIPNSQIMGWIRADLLADAKPKIKPKSEPPLPLKTAKKSGPRRSPYYGTCDCPYDRAKNGSRCGGRSAYSRPGGRSPVCYW